MVYFSCLVRIIWSNPLEQNDVDTPINIRTTRIYAMYQFIEKHQQKAEVRVIPRFWWHRTQNFKSMKVLKTVQWSFALLGYSNSNRYRISKRHVQVGLEYLLAVTLFCAYYLYVTDTTLESVDSIFRILVAVFILISFISTVRKTDKIFHLIETMENIINESK